MKQQCLVVMVVVLCWMKATVDGQASYIGTFESDSSEEECFVEGEYYISCGSACPVSCANYKTKYRACPLSCEAGCFCRPGLVRHQNNSCVLAEDCPVCGPNEEYSACDSHCGDTCDNFYKTPRICTRICRPGCRCAPGFAMNNEGVCVRPADCPVPKCQENASFNLCGTKCEHKCSNLGVMFKCVATCNPGCFCDPDYVKTKNQSCVLPENCPVEETCTKPHEYFTECKRPGPRTCADLGSSDVVEADVCERGCECKESYVRNKRGFCVQPEDCDPAEIS